jgi:hypothetical protein
MVDAEYGTFRRSSRCADNGCVEIATGPHGVLMRDSKLDSSPVVAFSRTAWRDFVVSARDGQFD